jgi:preprotein translocase subunits secD
MEENKLKTKKKKQNNKISLKILGRILTIIIIMLVSLGSFVGIFKLEQNAMKNIIPDYELGMDLYGARHIVAKVDDTNAEDMRTYDNYIKSKEIIEERLKFLEISDYLVRLDDATGEIDIEIPEDATTDYFAEYTGMQGKFTMTDDETSEVLLDNNSLKKASIQYGTSSAGTTVYLVIEFNKEGSSKLQEVSKTYIKSTDSEGNDTTKKVKMSIDDQTIMTTYFGEEMTDGIMQIPLGTTTDATDIQNYLKQASNISVFLNTEPLPIKYSVDINRFEYSDITENTLKIATIVLASIFAIMLIYMIIKYKANGILGALANVGFLALLLLAIRYGKVTLTLTGIAGIAIATIIEYVITMLVIKQYNKDTDEATVNKNVKNVMSNSAKTIAPILIMSVIFALIKWEQIASIGMVLFWAILIMVVYNAIILATKFYITKKNKKK